MVKMESNSRVLNRKFIALFIALMMIATQFVGMTVFAEYVGIAPMQGDPGYCEIRVSMPDTNVPAADWALCRGGPTSYSYSTVNTFKNNNALAPNITLSGGRIRIYEVTQPGLYSVVVLTRDYYDVVRMFNVTQEMIDEHTSGADLEIDVPTGPRTWEGWEPNRFAAGSPGFTPRFTADSRDQIMFVYPDEVYETWFSPEATNPDARFPYPEGGFQTPMFTQRDDMGMWQVTRQDQLMDFLQDEYDNFVQGTDDVYTFYDIVGQSGYYDFELPLVVFTKEDISECETLEEVGRILQESGKPTVWHQAQIHANEQGSGEGAIALIYEMYRDYGADILDDIDVVIVPRVNADGSKNHQRETTVSDDPYLSVDMNRDHMKMDAIELFWLHRAFYKVMPEVVIDGHEFDIFDGVNADGTIRGSWPLDDLMPAVSTGLNNGDDINRLNKDLNMAVIENSRDAGIRIENYQGTKCPALSRAYFGLSGSLSILFEGKGLGGAASHMARRAYVQYASAKAVYAYAAETAEELLEVTKARRDEVMQAGKVYDPDSVFVLRQGTAADTQFYTKPMGPHPGLNIMTNSVVGSLEADGPFTRNWADYSWSSSTLRTRSRPTAYVVPMDKIQNLSKFLWTLDGHSVEYFKAPEGLAIDKLQQYYWISGQNNTAIADLRQDDDNTVSVTFENGAIVVPMDQPQANVISAFFEPDVDDCDSYTVTAVQMGFIARDANNDYPLYRYIGDYPREIPTDDSIWLSTGAHNVKVGDYFVLNSGFYQQQGSNAAILTYTFDGDKFEYANFAPADGVQVANVEYEAGKAKITVISMDYDLRNFGEVMLRAKEDAALSNEYQTVDLNVEYVLKDEAGNKTIKTASTNASFTTLGRGEYGPAVPGDTNDDGVVDLIDLSNMIDWFGFDKTTPQWTEIYVFFDFNNSAEIDIYDISYVAKLI